MMSSSHSCVVFPSCLCPPFFQTSAPLSSCCYAFCKCVQTVLYICILQWPRRLHIFLMKDSSVCHWLHYSSYFLIPKLALSDAISVSSNSLCVLTSHGLLLSYPLPMTSKSSNLSSSSSLGSNLTITFPSCFSLGSNVTPLLVPIVTPSLVSWT